MKLKSTAVLAACLTAGALSASAGTVNILWYLGGVTSDGGLTGTGSYIGAINNLVAQEENPLFNVASVNTWNITYWNGGAMPTGAFNVLVTASPQGGWSSYPDFTDLLAAPGANAASDYGRVMLTGQDADWHYQYSPGPTNFDGPAGFLIDAINWAGSGTGMGGVFLGSTGLGIFGDIGTDIGGDNTVDIPPSEASFPINVGLTSAGLSDWDTSAHTSFEGFDPTLWNGINIGPDLDGGMVPITIVTASAASGGTGGGTVPDAASTSLLVVLGLASIVAARRYIGVAQS
jgi:hypothetical protein